MIPATRSGWPSWRNTCRTPTSSDWLNVYGYTIAQTLVATLKAAGNDLTRANVIKQATNLKDVRLSMLINGTAVE